MARDRADYASTRERSLGAWVQSVEEESPAWEAGIESGMAKMKTALTQMNDGRSELADTIDKMEAVKAAIPDRFDEGGQNYLAEIDEEAPTIQKVFQQTLNEGFKGMFILSAICSAVGVVILAFYRDDKHRIARKRG